MNRLLVILTYLVALLVSLNGLFGAAGDTAPQARPKTQVGPVPAADADQIAPGLRDAPLMFIENVGQFDGFPLANSYDGNTNRVGQLLLGQIQRHATLSQPVPK